MLASGKAGLMAEIGETSAKKVAIASKIEYFSL